jgi:hypothetical protein
MQIGMAREIMPDVFIGAGHATTKTKSYIVYKYYYFLNQSF